MHASSAGPREGPSQEPSAHERRSQHDPTAAGASAFMHPELDVELMPPRAGGPPAGAFFDLDKTVIAKSSALAFGGPLRREGLLTAGAALRGAYGQLVFQLLGADADRMERSRTAMLDVMHGWEAQRVRRLVRETLREVIDPLVYAEALDLFELHRRAGRALYLVSSAGEEVVEPLADHLGVPGVLATRAGVDEEGRYDGTLEFYCYGEHKAEAIRAEAARHGYDLAASFAYSDSITDVPLLEAVGHPVAVNPDRELRAVAEERGWTIREFRRRVALRQRLEQLPRPNGAALVGAGALGAAGVAAWAYRHRRQTSSPARRLVAGGR